MTTYEVDIDARSIGKLTLENSKYGKLEAESIEWLELTQSYEDDFDLEVVETLIAEESKYGKYSIGVLKTKMELVGYECDIDIKDISKEASNIDISGKYIETWINTNGRSLQSLCRNKIRRF